MCGMNHHKFNKGMCRGRAATLMAGPAHHARGHAHNPHAPRHHPLLRRGRVRGKGVDGEVVEHHGRRCLLRVRCAGQQPQVPQQAQPLTHAAHAPVHNPLAQRRTQEGLHILTARPVLTASSGRDSVSGGLCVCVGGWVQRAHQPPPRSLQHLLTALQRGEGRP